MSSERSRSAGRRVQTDCIVVSLNFGTLKMSSLIVLFQQPYDLSRPPTLAKDILACILDGADVNERDKDGKTVLHYHIECVGRIVHQTETESSATLEHLGDLGKASMVLQRNGADWSLADHEGCTPIMYAAKQAPAPPEIGTDAVLAAMGIHVLRRRHVYYAVNAKDKHRRTALMYAAASPQKHILDSSKVSMFGMLRPLMYYREDRDRDDMGRNALTYAIEHGRYGHAKSQMTSQIPRNLLDILARAARQGDSEALDAMREAAQLRGSKEGVHQLVMEVLDIALITGSWRIVHAFLLPPTSIPFTKEDRMALLINLLRTQTDEQMKAYSDLVVYSLLHAACYFGIRDVVQRIVRVVCHHRHHPGTVDENWQCFFCFMNHSRRHTLLSYNYYDLFDNDSLMTVPILQCICNEQTRWDPCSCTCGTSTCASDALHKAAEAGRVDLVQFLIAKGIDIHTKIYGRTAAMEAAAAGQLNTLKALMSLRQKDNRVLLEQAMCEPSTVRYQAGDDGDQRMKEVLEFLTNECGCSVATTTVLHRCIGEGLVASAKLVSSWGARASFIESIKQFKAQEKGVLRYRPKMGLCEQVRTCIEYGADVNERDEQGRTVFSHFADLMHKSADVVHYDDGLDDVSNMLVDIGADFTAPDNCGRTPIMYALEEPVRSFKYCWWEACLHLSSKRVIPEDKRDAHGQALLQMLSAQDNQGRTALMNAAAAAESQMTCWTLPPCQQLLNLAEELKSKAFIVDQQDVEGRTALWYAVNAGSAHNAKLLRHANASVECLKNVMQDAVECGNAGIVRAMIAIKSTSFETREHALRSSIERGHWQVVRELIKGNDDGSDEDDTSLPISNIITEAEHGLLLKSLDSEMVLTLLKAACYRGDEALVERIVGCHSDGVEVMRTTRDKHCSGCLDADMLSASKSRISASILQRLFDGGYVPISSFTALLHSAVKAERDDILEWILQNAADQGRVLDIIHEKLNGYTAAMWAAKSLRLNMLKVLVRFSQGQCLLDTDDHEGRSVILLVCLNRTTEDDSKVHKMLMFLVDECGISPTSGLEFSGLESGRIFSIITHCIALNLCQSTRFLVSRGAFMFEGRDMSAWPLYTALYVDPRWSYGSRSFLGQQRFKDEEIILEILDETNRQWREIMALALEILDRRVPKDIAHLVLEIMTGDSYRNDTTSADGSSNSLNLPDTARETLLKLATDNKFDAVVSKLSPPPYAESDAHDNLNNSRASRNQLLENVKKRRKV